MDYQQLQDLNQQIRIDLMNMFCQSKSGHPGGSLSSVEIISTLYNKVMRVDPANPQWADRDRFVFSKGHGAPALYAVLAHKGFFPVEELATLRKYGSRLQGHPDSKKTPGVDASTGSLGQGVSIAVGFALGARLAGKDYHTYALLGDGEMQEGQVWEAAMAAAHYKLDNLTFILDNNGLQIDGTNEQVMSLGDIHQKMAAFGFKVIEVNGHDLEQLEKAFQVKATGQPKFILAHTVKGKGVSFMENQVGWHGKAPSDEEVDKAVCELGGVQK
ncbi:transketolase subunit A [Hydrogenispora ethanolica]|jgi:transketolase|uniref:Transketolase subunit A n=1 Tax=Hydrogenispora ethanolica TaxID=1082276 RepID=A0A4R1RY28_HYDET|nr:transketolase [Hydrogenispora ethanolica]TCL70882.1 transketolase subunit A [Hydrogenispora ethanolica]